MLAWLKCKGRIRRERKQCKVKAERAGIADWMEEIGYETERDSLYIGGFLFYTLFIPYSRNDA